MKMNSNRQAVLSWILLIAPGISTTSLGAEPKYMEHPFAVIAFSGLGQTQTKLEQFGKLSGNMQPLEQFLAIQANLGKISGINRNRAVGGVLVLERAKLALPAAVFLIPVTNGTKLIAELRKKYPVFQTISKGKWKVNIPGLDLYVSLQDDYLAISQSRPTLTIVTKELLNEINKNTTESDMFTTLHFDGMSDPLRERILNGFDIDLNRALQQRPDETEESLQRRTKVLELIRATARQLVFDTQTLTAALKMNADVHFNLELHARADSEFEKVASQLMLDEKQFSITPQAELPLHLEFGLKLPEPAQRVAHDLLKSAGEKFIQELKPNLSESELTSVTDVIDLLEQTLLQEKMDGFVSIFEGEEHQLRLVGGSAIPDEKKLATALEATLPHIGKSESISTVELNIAGSQPVQLHRLRCNDQLKEAQLIYGPEASLFVGTSPKAIWGGIGSSEVPRLLRQSQREITPGSPEILSIKFSADQWLSLAEKHELNPERMQHYRQAIPNGQNDQFQFNLKATPKGLQATLRAEQNYLKLFGPGNQPSPAR